MLLCRAARWATLCRQAPKAAAVGAAQRVLWPAHAVPYRSTDMKAPRRCSVECAHGTGTCLRGRKGAPRARCGCTRGACWFFAKAVHSHGYAMASCMRNRTIALFTTRHLAEVPADLGRGIEGAQASTEQQPIVRLSSILGPCDTCIEYVHSSQALSSFFGHVSSHHSSSLSFQDAAVIRSCRSARGARLGAAARPDGFSRRILCHYA